MRPLKVTLGPRKGLGREGRGEDGTEEMKGALEPSRLPHLTPVMWMKKPRPREEERADQIDQLLVES